MILPVAQRGQQRIADSHACLSKVTLNIPGGDEVFPHSGTRAVLNCDGSGFKRPMITGLLKEQAGRENLMRYHLARERTRSRQETRDTNSK